MCEYAVPLSLGNFNLNNKETRRLELWKNRRGMWFDHVEHMEKGPEQNKEWENFWWTVDEDMFTYVMKTKIEGLIEEKLNQEFPEEVEIREDPDYDSEEEMTSETEETDDDESETNNANVNNYMDSANVVTNLETAMKIAEEEDLWIGGSGASSHMMGSEEHVFNKKLITGSVRTANGAHMKMQEGGFKLSEADPCMLYKEDEKGVCIIIIYIDDMLIIGKEEAIDDAIKVLQGHFQVKDPTRLEDYLGVQIVQSDDGKKAWLGQPTIIKSLEKQFGDRVAKKKMRVTPGTPEFIGGKVDDISKVDEKTQSMYRSGVGTLLYLTKHSRPDITNPVRELSKSTDGASMAQVTEMYRVIDFVLEMKTLGLRMVPIFNDGVWKLEALSDSDFANDKDTRYSGYGYII